MLAVPRLKDSLVALTNKNGSPAKLEVPFENSNRRALSEFVSKIKLDNTFVISGETFFLLIVPLLWESLDSVTFFSI